MNVTQIALLPKKLTLSAIGRRELILITSMNELVVRTRDDHI